MNRLQFPHAKLLYGVSKLYKTSRIDDNERKELKGTQLVT